MPARFLKVITYPQTDAAYVRARREHAWFEAKRVLGNRNTNLLPEPLDYLEVANSCDTSSLPGPEITHIQEPVLVFEKVHGEPLPVWSRQFAPSPTQCLRILGELLQLLQVIHKQSFLLNGLTPCAVWVDQFGACITWRRRWFSTGSEQTSTASYFHSSGTRLAMRTPEVRDAAAELDERLDVFSWAAVACFLLSGRGPTLSAGAPSEGFGLGHFETIHRQLRGLTTAEVQMVGGWLGATTPQFQATWPDGFPVRSAALPGRAPRRQTELRCRASCLAVGSATRPGARSFGYPPL